MTDMAYLCNLHKVAAVINLDLYDRIHAPDNGKNRGKTPGDVGVVKKDNTSPVPKSDWKQVAAKKADDKAIPEDPNTKKFKIPTIPTPRSGRP